MLVASDGHFFKHDQHIDQQYVRFKDYQDAYPDWHIPPDKTTKSTLYWKWFICKYETQLLQYYWRASEASETLTGVTQLKIGDVCLLASERSERDSIRGG